MQIRERTCASRAFSREAPGFFIDFLTDPGDLVLDFFAGANTIGAAAEKAARRWIAFEQHLSYLAASAFRFVPPHLQRT